MFPSLVLSAAGNGDFAHTLLKGFVYALVGFLRIYVFVRAKAISAIVKGSDNGKRKFGASVEASNKFDSNFSAHDTSHCVACHGNAFFQ